MADYNSSDPDIEAAFSNQPPPPAAAPTVSTDDPDIEAAFKDSDTVSSAAPQHPFFDTSSLTAKHWYNPLSWPISEVAMHEGTSLGSGLKAGAGAINDLLHGKSISEARRGAERVVKEGTYIPKAEIASAVVQGLESPINPLNWPAKVTEYAGKGITALGTQPFMPEPVREAAVYAGPLVEGAANVGLGTYGAAKALGLGETPPVRNWTESPQSMGSGSSTFPATAVRNMSPELRAAASKLDPNEINPEVLGRHLEADSLPVRMRLTEGQATQNPDIISTEMNNRGATGLSQVFNEQNAQLKQNVAAIRDKIGPDVFTTNPVEHADTIIGAYKAKAAAADADITAKYQALRDANGGKFPVDAKKLLDTATANLHDKLLFDHAPKAVMSTLDRLADSGNMTFENFESLRTNLARVARSSADGNERAAAGIIRDAMEQMPLSDSAAKLKPLADNARAAARAQFQALRDDPAYNAAVNETVPPDRFVSRFIINGPRDDVATMRANLADNPTATQTMGVAALDHLRTQAGIGPTGEGNFSQAAFNKHLQALTPKALSLFDGQTANELETLGNVARYTQFQPRGNVINTSGTLSGAIAEYGKGTLEGAVNYGFKGVPVGSWTRKFFQQRALHAELENATEPLAGVQKTPKK